MARKYEDFDEEGQDGFFDQVLTIISKRKRGFAIASVVAAVVLLGLVVFGSYPEDTEIAANESVPIVRADAGEYKTTPDNPGGMEIPYRDSTVFDAADNASGTTENILAEDTSEEPVPRSQLFAGLNTEGDQPGGAPVENEAPAVTADEVAASEQFAKAASVEAPTDDALVKEAIGVPAEETPAATTKTAAVEKAAPVEEPAAEAKAAAKTEPAAGTTAAKAVTGGSHYVQLASVKNTAGAEAEFKKLQAKYSALNGIKYRTQEANLGAKGTFYRIQAGPMSKEEATRICTDIKSKGGSCLVAGK